MYCTWTASGERCESHAFVFLIQLGPVTPTSVQANHTSAVGQVESVNFTIIPTAMADGCHIQVTHRCLLMIGGRIEMLLLQLQTVTCLRDPPCRRPGSAWSITAPTTATFATSWKAGARTHAHTQPRVHADKHSPFLVHTGSGLTKAPGFVEFTNEWLCLGYIATACK